MGDPGPGYQHSPWLLVAPEARLVGMIISTSMPHLGVPGGRVPFASEPSSPPLDPACCCRAFSLDSSQLISELVHETISPSHPVINKCPVRDKIDGGPVAKPARLVRI